MFRMLVLLVLCFVTTVFLANAHEGEKNPKAGWEALAELQNGNMRFFEGKQKHPRQDSEKREKLVSGQNPQTILVSCSDSRVPPEEIFDQGLGDIFSIRVAGNVANPDELASIEYAIEHVGSRLLIVMGHESCGAVAAAVKFEKGVSNGSENLDHLVGKIFDQISSSAISNANTDKTMRMAVKENVSATLREIYKNSAIVREAVEKKGLVLGQAVYSLKSGRVEFWNVGKAISLKKEESSGPVIEEEHVHSEMIEKKP